MSDYIDEAKQFRILRQLARNITVVEDTKYGNELMVAKSVVLDNKNDRKAFENAVDYDKKIRSKHVVKITDRCYDKQGNLTHIIMPYYEAGSLDKVLKARTDLNGLGLNNTFKIIEQVLEAVVELHKMKPQILHRDIKPENILVTNIDSFAIVLADFDIAYQLDGRTDPKRGAGTFPYRPPEQKKGNATAKSDVFAIAVLFIQLLTNDLSALRTYNQDDGFFGEKPTPQEIRNRLQALWKSERFQAVNVPRALVALLERALTLYEPHHRPDAKLFLDTLQSLGPNSNKTEGGKTETLTSQDLWEFQCGMPISVAPCATEGHVYVCTDTGKVLIIARYGQEQGKCVEAIDLSSYGSETGIKPSADPVLWENVLFIPCDNGILFHIRLDTSKVNPIEIGGVLTASPILDRGIAYQVTTGNGQTGSGYAAVAPSQGRITNSRLLTGKTFMAKPVVLDESLFLADNFTNGKRGFLYRFPLDRNGSPDAFLSLSAGVRSALLADVGRQLLYIADESGTVWAINPRKNSVVWQSQSLRGGVKSAMTMTEDRLFIGDRTGCVYCLRLDGPRWPRVLGWSKRNVAWSAPVCGAGIRTLIFSKKTLIVLDELGNIEVLNSEDGSKTPYEAVPQGEWVGMWLDRKEDVNQLILVSATGRVVAINT